MPGRQTNLFWGVNYTCTLRSCDRFGYGFHNNFLTALGTCKTYQKLRNKPHFQVPNSKLCSIFHVFCFFLFWGVNYTCTLRSCDRFGYGFRKNIHWGYFNQYVPTCLDCQRLCNNEPKCHAFECSHECFWWNNGTCTLDVATENHLTCRERTGEEKCT